MNDPNIKPHPQNPRPNSIPLWFKPKPMRLISPKLDSIIKRLFDMMIVLYALPALSLILLLIAILVKLESPMESILVRQKRRGKGGTIFDLMHFRTTTRRTDPLQASLYLLSDLQLDPSQRAAKPKLTHIGRFLRRTNLYVLPQMLNVLRGDMSLIGPKPSHPAAERPLDNWESRTAVTPGLIGLWETIGQKSMKLEDREEIEEAYATQRNFWLDLQILCRVLLSNKSRP